MDEIFVCPPTFFPSRFAFENFVEAWNTAPFGRYFINTIIVTGPTVASHFALACLTAYAFVSIRFSGRNLLFLVFLMVMIPVFFNRYLIVLYLGADSNIEHKFDPLIYLLPKSNFYHSLIISF